MKNKSLLLILLIGALAISVYAIQSKLNKQKSPIPESLSNISYLDDSLVFTLDDTIQKRYTIEQENQDRVKWQLNYFDEAEKGNTDGIEFHFKKSFNGTLIYGLYGDEPMEYAFAVYFKEHEIIQDGKAFVNIREKLSGVYDLALWEKRKKGRLAYRVLDEENNVIFNKSISFTVDEEFIIVPDITWGPFLSSQSDQSISIKFATNLNCTPKITVNNKEYSSKEGKDHELKISNLTAETSYDYTIQIGENEHQATFTTAPTPGSKKKFTFAFASDSRGGTQKGETNTKGHNADIMKKLAALAVYKNVDFWQFTGDMIDGYRIDRNEMDLEYTNWLTSISPFMHSTPLNVGMGNHEILMNTFGDPEKYFSVDGFPYDVQSGEALFSYYFINPTNGPESEDGSKYDLHKKSVDYPSYKENVFSYNYGNLAMIVLNSNYWYTPNHQLIPSIGGNPHGYIMDNQLLWLKGEISKYEQDPNIQHVFVTIHTPAFPNGGHAKNDMWYDGNNDVRPWISGKAVDQGIIERRDETIDLLVNQSTKFRVLLTGDEHNYSRLIVDENTEIYPNDWKGEKLVLSRPFVQIVDGAAGAPYYAQEELPWTPSVKKFSSQYALVIFSIEGEQIDVEVINPNTLEVIEKVKL